MYILILFMLKKIKVCNEIDFYMCNILFVYF
ncbi:hypothetical protein BAN_0900009 [Borrelia anserina BA2]|uniref:Uncharacterized protein n=1 Tax=Borrelia anserina BA2 TaxID=1313293 RepID=W5SMP4_BORAN|nr:hypothetical protein BAN_0900009 [Borrelia anserina BA2]